MPRHLAFVGRNGAGHVNPTLPLVAELVRRGHRVTYALEASFAEASSGPEPRSSTSRPSRSGTAAGRDRASCATPAPT
jgi:UDP-N-acetylglucosamine:LPS N-acetylglucosamine transferase